MHVVLEAAGTCLVTAAIFFAIGRYLYWVQFSWGKSPLGIIDRLETENLGPLWGHGFAFMGTLVAAAHEYKSGVSLSTLLIICALICIGLLVNYSRLMKRQPRI